VGIRHSGALSHGRHSPSATTCPQMLSTLGMVHRIG
jgi:hypothetical protein